MVDQRAGNGHTLLLAAGKQVYVALFIAFQVNQRQHFRHPLFDLIFRHLLDAQTERDILKQYIGENVKEDDIHAKYESGVLKINIPKEEAKEPEAEKKKYIAIEG